MSIFLNKPDDLIDNSKEIIYQITDWFIPENDKIVIDYANDPPREYTINIYGKNKDGVSICTKVVDFKPFFYIKPPEEWESLDDNDFKRKVDELHLQLLDGSYDSKFKGKITKKKIISNYYNSHLAKISIEKKKDFWGFTNNKEFRYIKLSFKSLALFNNLKFYFQDNKDGFVLYESNIEPFLKFIHIQKIKPCGWIKVSKYSLDDAPETRCDYNISAVWSDIIPVEINTIAPLIVASFDIECSSSHGDFPVAIKDYKKLAQDLCMISKANLDDKNLIKNIINAFTDDVIINDYYKINRLYSKTKLTENEKSKLAQREEDIRFILNKIKTIDYIDENEEVEENDDDEDEKPAIKKYKMTVKESNEIEECLNEKLKEILPELEGDKIIQIGTTIHIYGNDEIIYKSIITLDSCDKIDGSTVIPCKNEKDLLLAWKQEIMRINPDIMIGYNIWGFDMEYIWNRTKELNITNKFSIGFGKTVNRNITLIEQKLSSSALGDNCLKLFDMDGIVTIDLFKVMQRDHKLDSYKLDNVASIFIGSNKDDLKPKEIFEKFKGNSTDRCVIAKYCIQDCILVNKLLHKLKIIENNSGMGNVCLVPLSYLFKRGQGIKIYSLITNECMKRNFVIPVKKYVINDIDIDNGYEGAIVLEPKEGIYLDEPIVVFDYGSLYPSSMISRNLSHDTYVLDDKYMKIDDDNVEFENVYYDIYEGLGDKKHKVGVKKCIFAKYKDGRCGVIPDILTLLLEERKNTRNKIEHSTIIKKDNTEITGTINNNNEHDIIITDINKKKLVINKKEIKEIKDTYNKFEKDVFDALQTAYKLTANSLYGQIGARTSAIYLKDIAACTTATGREMIMKAKEYVETNYDANVIYGDTDSIFCKFPLKNKNGELVYGKDSLPYAIEIGKTVEKNIASIMPYPQKLNYEKSLYPFILFSKKRYVGNLYENDVNKFKQKSMGIVLKRRDNANIVKKIYGGIINIILNQQDLEKSVKFLKEELDDLVNGKTDIKDLIISKTLRSSYKDPTKIAHKVLADRIGIRDAGNKPAANDRIAYIYIKVPDAKLQGDKIETPEYIVENKLEPDYLHYITNQIMKPVLQLYALCLTDLEVYKEKPDYWENIDNELKLKPMYNDDMKRKRRLDNLKLQKVQELLFDEFIYKLKEPKKKAVRIAKEKKTVKATITDSTSEIANGEIKIINSKVKNGLCYNVKIVKNGEVIMNESKESITDNTKDKLLNMLLIRIHKENKDIRMKIKINYKDYVKKFNILVSKYDEFIERAGKFDKKNNDISLIKLQKEIIDNASLLEIKDYITLE
jgi:DNA polymerase elongation subunit (family B)